MGGVMFNSYCRTIDLPFNNNCDKQWKIFDDPDKIWADDEYLTFDCKNKTNNNM